MSKSVLNVCSAFSRDNLAKFISHTWQTYNIQRQGVIENWKELRNYVFATDTTSTTNASLPWKNSTTIPKLCQIRDNLHSNYISALFPNDDWLKWEGYSLSDSTKAKARAITGYMSNKTRVSNFRGEVSKLLYDYIDYGNVFATVDFERLYSENTRNERIPSYIGPVVRRISPYDIVFNPLASSFQDSWKIVRSLRPVSDLRAMVDESSNDSPLREVFANREKLLAQSHTHTFEDTNKDEGFLMDGFGNYQEYLGSDFVEFLDFYGDIYDEDSKTLLRGYRITVIDRMWVVVKEPLPSWLGHAPIYHVGWRVRTDNLWAMGPLENLVGMQYRIDHLENIKADAMDLAIMPPLVIKGEVEQFDWGPNAEIHIDENGEVTELARNVQWVIQADNAIDRLEMRMEQYAGAPREAMGIRSPGEKTMFEVQQLQNAAGRIFQEKINNFEVDILEKVLNAMLETSKRNMDPTDTIRVMDNDIGYNIFVDITKDDITASGVLRPIGARHFAAQANLMQNIVGISNTPIWQQIAPHTSAKQLALMVEDILNVNRYSIFQPNIAISEQQDTQRAVNQAQEDLAVEQQTPVQ